MQTTRSVRCRSSAKGVCGSAQRNKLQELSPKDAAIPARASVDNVNPPLSGRGRNPYPPLSSSCTHRSPAFTTHPSSIFWLVLLCSCGLICRPRGNMTSQQNVYCGANRSCVYTRRAVARLGNVFVCKVSTEQHERDEHEQGAVDVDEERKTRKATSELLWLRQLSIASPVHRNGGPPPSAMRRCSRRTDATV